MAKRTHIKCEICKELVPIENKYELEYMTKNCTFSKKHGHQICVENWYKEYTEWNELEKELLNILDIPELSKTIIQRLRELHRNYSYEIIKLTATEKKNDLKKNFDKGWNYLFAIISNSVAFTYKEEQRKNKQIQIINNNIKPIEEFDITYQKKENKGDISSILD